MQRLTTSTTAPSCPRDITVLLRSFWVGLIFRPNASTSVFSQKPTVVFIVPSALFLQSWAGATPVMCGASAVSCLNTMLALLCFR